MPVHSLSSGHKLGKLPAHKRYGLARLSDFVDKTKLPPIPDSFGHDDLIPADGWGMAANDRVGDCVIAMHLHASMLWNATAGRKVRFSDQTAISDYSAITGYDPKDPSTDQGTDMMAAATYAQRTGFVDTSGVRHKIGAAIQLNPGSLSDVWAAMYLGGMVGIGVELPQSAEDQMSAGQEWTYVRGSPNLGGHCMGMPGKRGELLRFVTWGKEVYASQYWFSRYCDEAFGYFSEEQITNGKNIDGFDSQSLLEYIKAIG